MATPIIMPRQGQSVESCIITAWNKKVGDTVEKGEILFSYETDKSSFDEPAPESGKLLAIFHEEGDDVPCLENVCVIGNDGEDFAQFAPASEDDSAPAEEVKTETATVAAVEVPAEVVASADANGAISPRAKLLADKTGADLLKATPTAASSSATFRVFSIAVLPFPQPLLRATPLLSRAAESTARSFSQISPLSPRLLLPQ